MLSCMMVSARGAALERQPQRWPSCTSSSLSLLETVSSGDITILLKKKKCLCGQITILFYKNVCVGTDLWGCCLHSNATWAGG